MNRLLHRPWREMRAVLEALDLSGERWHTTPSFADGEALHANICARGLEGTIAKHSEGTYRPGSRDAPPTRAPRGS